jgi:tetratricopeptide (TPR) repeat protein
MGRTDKLRLQLLALLGLGLLGISAGCASTAMVSSPQQAADKHQTLGDQFYERKRFTEALREWRLALTLDPTRQDVAKRIAAVEGGQPWHAQPAAVAGEESSRLRQELLAAETYYQTSQLKEAEVAWRRILEWNSGQPEAVAGLERLAAETYETDARRSFDQMTRDLYEQGMRAYRKQAWEQSELKLAEAAKLNPDQPQVQRYLETTRLQLAQMKQAAAAETIQRQAMAAEAAGQWVSAYRHWQALAQTQSLTSEATQGLERCRPHVAEWAKGQNAEGRRLLDAGQATAAVARFQQVLELLPQEPQALRGREEARRIIAQAKTQSTTEDEGRRHFNAGVASYRQGDLTGAIREWEQAVSAAPADAEYQEWLARAKKELAGRDTQNRQRAEARYADGLAAYQRGELDEALAAWKEVLELDPSHEKARLNMQKIEKEMK